MPAELRESPTLGHALERGATPCPSDGGIGVDCRRMTMQTGGRWRPSRSAWLVLLAAVLVAVVAGYGISWVHDYAAERGKLKNLLAELETAAYHESALEWQVITQPGQRSQLAEEWHEVDEATHRLADQLGMLDSESEQANRQANLGTLLILLAAAINVGALAWRFERVESKAAERFAYQALHDGLTGLPNRILLRDRTGQAIRQADRELVPAALLLIDLDRFKEVNDTLGHHYGDQLLVQVGERLRATLRQADTVARLGGDEFAVLLPRIETAEGAVAVAN